MKYRLASLRHELKIRKKNLRCLLAEISIFFISDFLLYFNLWFENLRKWGDGNENKTKTIRVRIIHHTQIQIDLILITMCIDSSYWPYLTFLSRINSSTFQIFFLRKNPSFRISLDLYLCFCNLSLTCISWS